MKNSCLTIVCLLFVTVTTDAQSGGPTKIPLCSGLSIVTAISQQDGDYEIAVDRYIIEIEHTRSDMAKSQERIERLRSETSGLLAETRQVLSKLAA